MSILNIFFALSICYLIGSIPTAYIFGKVYKRIDIREYGSGNVGATNTFRVLGKLPGILVLVLDIAKGLLAVTVIGDICDVDTISQRTVLGVCAVSGHNWPIFLNFKGGKGIATSLGVLIGLTIKFPSLGPAVLSCVITWVIVFLILGYVSVSSVVAAVILPIMLLITNHSIDMILLGVLLCIFIVFRHRSNVKRLLEGKEPRVPFPFNRRK